MKHTGCLDLQRRQLAPPRLSARRLSEFAGNQPGAVSACQSGNGHHSGEGEIQSKSPGMHTALAGRWAQPNGHLGSQAEQPVPVHLDQRCWDSGFGTPAARRQADGQAIDHSDDVYRREQPSTGELLRNDGPSAESCHGVSQLWIDHHQGNGRPERCAAPHPCTAVGSSARLRRVFQGFVPWS